MAKNNGLIIGENVSLNAKEVEKIRNVLGISKDYGINKLKSKYNNGIIGFEFNNFVISKEVSENGFTFYIAKVGGRFLKNYSTLDELVSELPNYTKI